VTEKDSNGLEWTGISHILVTPHPLCINERIRISSRQMGKRTVCQNYHRRIQGLLQPLLVRV